MDQRIFFAIFFIVFLSVFFAIHYYIFIKIVKLFSVKNPMVLAYVIFALFLSFPLMNFVERAVSHVLIRWLYTLSSVWVGMMFYLLFLFLLYDLLKLVGITIDPFKAGVSILILAALIVSYGIVNARIIKVKEIDIAMDIPPELDGYTIVQISDIHAGAVNGARFVQKNVDIANSLDADTIVITGDLFDGSGHDNLSALIEPISRLKSKHGVYFVTGNHENYIGTDLTLPAIESHGVKVLRNDVVNAGGISFVGIDNPRKEMQKSNPEIHKLKDSISGPTVLLYHVPLGMKDAAEAGVDLQLSGHTHGGQLFPFNIFELPFYPVLKGYGEVDGIKLYVSVGSGTWGPPLRVGMPAEITKITLVHGSSA